MWRKSFFILIFCVFSVASWPSGAAVIEFEILRIESPAFGGKNFGATGTYDRIFARAKIGVAPADSHNSIIADIDLAPRNESGLVEAASDVEILRPTNADTGNGVLFYDTPNRGNKLGWTLFHDLMDTNVLDTAETAGNGFLLSNGYTIVWSGWQTGLQSGGGRLGLQAPSINGVTGTVVESFSFGNDAAAMTALLTYPLARVDPGSISVFAKRSPFEAAQTPDDLNDAVEGPNKIVISRPKGFGLGADYVISYQAKDPVVLGLGLASIRDIVAFLKEGKAQDKAGRPLLSPIKKSIGFGLSQTGRLMHEFLYLGFNTSESDRIIFDGLLPYVGGSKRGPFNKRFGLSDQNILEGSRSLVGFGFPFTYPATIDVQSGKRDGWLVKCAQSNTCPKIIDVNTENEFYQAAASLLATDTSGKAIQMLGNVRLFLLSNMQHFKRAPAKPTTLPNCQFPTNELNSGAPMRALLSALEQWVTSDIAPPASRYPSRLDKTLVSPNQTDVGFPTIPGVSYPKVLFLPQTNPDQQSDGQALIGKPAFYPVFLPRTDRDGRDIAGLRVPSVEVPLATYMGWNLQNDRYNAGHLCGLTGSTIALPKDKAARLASGDPRLSIEERYSSSYARQALLGRAADKLIRDRLLLAEDKSLFVH